MTAIPHLPTPSNHIELCKLVAEITNSYLSRTDANAIGALSAVCAVYVNLLQRIYGQAAVPALMRHTADRIEVAISASQNTTH